MRIFNKDVIKYGNCSTICDYNETPIDINNIILDENDIKFIEENKEELKMDLDAEFKHPRGILEYNQLLYWKPHTSYHKVIQKLILIKYKLI
jgi:hypothetical protein